MDTRSHKKSQNGKHRHSLIITREDSHTQTDIHESCADIAVVSDQIESRDKNPNRHITVSAESHYVITNPIVITSEIITPETIAPVSITPETIAPESITPETIAPVSITPETITPEIIISKIITPVSITPETIAPESITPETIAPVSITPETIAPESITPEIIIPDIYCASIYPTISEFNASDANNKNVNNTYNISIFGAIIISGFLVMCYWALKR
jgi:hypothetical protein